MAFKFNPNAAEDRKYVSKAGAYTATVQASKQDYLPPRADLYARITFVTNEGETVFGFQSDEAERDMRRTGVNVDLTPWEGLAFTVSYFRRDVEFPKFWSQTATNIVAQKYFRGLVGRDAIMMILSGL